MFFTNRICRHSSLACHAEARRRRVTRHFAFAALVAGALLLGAAAADATTRTVTNTSDNAAFSLRALIAASAAGDTINFNIPTTDPGYNAAIGVFTITLTSGQLAISRDLNIIGLTNAKIAVSGNNASRVFDITAGNVAISGLTITNGNGGNGVAGGIFSERTSTLTVTGCTISGNIADSGGGIFNGGTVNITNSTLSGNSATSGGGGILNSGTATITNSTISGNHGDFGGGGIFTNPGTVTTITNSTISGNSANVGVGVGGGIYNNGTLTLTNSTISGNTTTGNNNSLGGGIYNNGTATITNSTISGNSANASFGGGIDNAGGTMTITNSTIFGNSANFSGGINNSNNGTLTITNSTIFGNSASSAGGISNNSGTVNARNTIIAKNTSPSGGPDFAGTLTSQGFNLIGNSSGGTITPMTGDQIGGGSQPVIDPKLDTTLNDNGGPTFTLALGSGSPAINKGHSSGSNTDQRGFPRPAGLPNGIGDGGDIGAYEVQADLLPGCNTINRIVNNNSDSGTDSLRAVIANVCPGSTITFDMSPGKVVSPINLTSAELLISKGLTINGPGADKLTVQRSAGNFRIFHITSGKLNAISGLTIANGNPADSGGGIYNESNSALTVTGCAISGNSANTNSGFTSSGGGIYNFNATLTLTTSTISGNTATGNGGGINNSGTVSGTMTVTNSTIFGNTSTGNGGGGGIYNFNATLTLTNSTISGNTANGSGGGIDNASGTVNAKNTIIAKNAAMSSPDFNGTLTSQDFNLIGDGTGAAISPTFFSDQVTVTAAQLNLGPLQNNGGPTFTQALGSGSFAIDKGGAATDPVTGNPITTDQRGFSRPVDNPAISNAIDSGADGSDIGAFEVQAPTPTPTPTPTPRPTATPGLVANVSTRLPVSTGDNVLIEGFTVQGPGGSTKKIIVRAIGPSLVPFGITDAVANPTLEIHDSNNGNAIVATNDDWRVTQVGGIITADQSAEIAASGFAPGNDRESAIIANLPPGSYTAVVRGAGNSVGTGVVDAFDLSPAASAKLVNIATRGLIQPGDKLMIAGFITQNGPVRAVVSAIGPSLAAFGITNALPDTTLQLRDGNGAIVVENDDWKVASNGTSQQAELEATGLQPTNDLEAAVLVILPPGAYTAQVRGKPETTGTGVVQVYFLP
jgi:hypothetical protein